MWGFLLEGVSIDRTPLFYMLNERRDSTFYESLNCREIEMSMAQTHRTSHGGEYLKRLNSAVPVAETDVIDHHPAERDAPDWYGFKHCIRDMRADATQVRLAG